MTLKVFFTPDAKSDIRLGREQLRESSWELGERFFQDIKATTNKIARNPAHYAIVYKNVRQCRLDNFPHVVSYLVVENTVQVLAIVHGHRDPRIWKGRSNS